MILSLVDIKLVKHILLYPTDLNSAIFKTDGVFFFKQKYKRKNMTPCSPHKVSVVTVEVSCKSSLKLTVRLSADKRLPRHHFAPK